MPNDALPVGGGGSPIGWLLRMLMGNQQPQQPPRWPADAQGIPENGSRYPSPMPPQPSMPMDGQQMGSAPSIPPEMMDPTMMMGGMPPEMMMPSMGAGMSPTDPMMDWFLNPQQEMQPWGPPQQMPTAPMAMDPGMAQFMDPFMSMQQDPTALQHPDVQQMMNPAPPATHPGGNYPPMLVQDAYRQGGPVY